MRNLLTIDDNLIPAYGRDYQTYEEVRAAWEENQDFQSIQTGYYLSRKEAIEHGLTCVMIRFDKLQRKIILDL